MVVTDTNRSNGSVPAAASNRPSNANVSTNNENDLKNTAKVVEDSELRDLHESKFLEDEEKKPKGFFSIVIDIVSRPIKYVWNKVKNFFSRAPERQELKAGRAMKDFSSAAEKKEDILVTRIPEKLILNLGNKEKLEAKLAEIWLDPQVDFSTKIAKLRKSLIESVKLRARRTLVTAKQNLNKVDPANFYADFIDIQLNSFIDIIDSLRNVIGNNDQESLNILLRTSKKVTKACASEVLKELINFSDSLGSSNSPNAKELKNLITSQQDIKTLYLVSLCGIQDEGILRDYDYYFSQVNEYDVISNMDADAVHEYLKTIYNYFKSTYGSFVYNRERNTFYSHPTSTFCEEDNGLFVDLFSTLVRLKQIALEDESNSDKDLLQKIESFNSLFNRLYEHENTFTNGVKTYQAEKIGFKVDQVKKYLYNISYIKDTIGKIHDRGRDIQLMDVMDKPSGRLAFTRTILKDVLLYPAMVALDPAQAENTKLLDAKPVWLKALYEDYKQKFIDMKLNYGEQYVIAKIAEFVKQLRDISGGSFKLRKFYANRGLTSFANTYIDDKLLHDFSLPNIGVYFTGARSMYSNLTQDNYFNLFDDRSISNPKLREENKMNKYKLFEEAMDKFQAVLSEESVIEGNPARIYSIFEQSKNYRYFPIVIEFLRNSFNKVGASQEDTRTARFATYLYRIILEYLPQNNQPESIKYRNEFIKLLYDPKIRAGMQAALPEVYEVIKSTHVAQSNKLVQQVEAIINDRANRLRTMGSESKDMGHFTSLRKWLVDLYYGNLELNFNKLKAVSPEEANTYYQPNIKKMLYNLYKVSPKAIKSIVDSTANKEVKKYLADLLSVEALQIFANIEPSKAFTQDFNIYLQDFLYRLGYRNDDRDEGWATYLWKNDTQLSQNDKLAIIAKEYERVDASKKEFVKVIYNLVEKHGSFNILPRLLSNKGHIIIHDDNSDLIKDLISIYDYVLLLQDIYGKNISQIEGDEIIEHIKDLLAKIPILIDSESLNGSKIDASCRKLKNILRKLNFTQNNRSLELEWLKLKEIEARELNANKEVKAYTDHALNKFLYSKT